jgi:hypothetical protein
MIGVVMRLAANTHDCNDYNACTDDYCDESSGCYYKPHDCDDYNACMTILVGGDNTLNQVSISVHVHLKIFKVFFSGKFFNIFSQFFFLEN